MKESTMRKYKIWVRINAYQTANIYMYAENGLQARMLAEGQYGVGQVLHYMEAD